MKLMKYEDFIVESKKDNLWTYEGDFKVDSSMILNGKFIKDKIPDIITGYFSCSGFDLISLEGGPEKVEGDYYCSYNKLTSLEGVPEKVRGSFSCHSNKLTSLEGGLKEVGGSIYSDFKIEGYFIKTGSYTNKYWEDLLKYMITENIDLTEIKSWPKDFLTDETIKSAKGISKFNL